MNFINFIHHGLGRGFFISFPLLILGLFIFLAKKDFFLFSHQDRKLAFYTTVMFAIYNLTWHDGPNFFTGYSEDTILLGFYIVVLTPIVVKIMELVFCFFLSRTKLRE